MQVCLAPMQQDGCQRERTFFPIHHAIDPTQTGRMNSVSLRRFWPYSCAGHAWRMHSLIGPCNNEGVSFVKIGHEDAIPQRQIYAMLTSIMYFESAIFRPQWSGNDATSASKKPAILGRCFSHHHRPIRLVQSVHSPRSTRQLSVGTATCPIVRTAVWLFPTHPTTADANGEQGTERRPVFLWHTADVSRACQTCSDLLGGRAWFISLTAPYIQPA